MCIRDRNTPVQIVGTHQGSAFGSALFGAVAAGRENGGFSHILEAVSYTHLDVYKRQPFE